MSMTKNTTPFDYGDEQLRKILQTVKKEFNKQRLKSFMQFDEVNTIKLKKSVKALYKKLDDLNRTMYLLIAIKAYAAACAEIGVVAKKLPGEKWLLAMLNSSDPVTEYVYSNEVERKRDRFFEALIVLLAIKHTKADIEREYKKAIKYWARQTEQYEINVVSNARRQAFADNDVEYVRWNTQRDGRVCGSCGERDGQIYAIDDIPESHYNCRCYLTAV